MEILRSAKNNKPIDSGFASGLIGILQIQILRLFLLSENIPIYGTIVKFAEENSPMQSLVLFNFGLNLLQLFYVIIKIIFSLKNNQEKIQGQKSSILRFLQIKPYLFAVQIISINTLSFMDENRSIKFMGAFNIFFLVLEIILSKTINISFRFLQKNYIRRKNGTIIQWLLIFPLIFTIYFYESLYASIFLVARALTQLYWNFHSLQNQEIRRSDWLYPLLSIELGFIVVIQHYFSVPILSNLAIFSTIILLTIYSCSEIADNFSLLILKYHLRGSQYVLETQNEDINNQNGGVTSINQKQLQKAVLHLRILVKIYISRLQQHSYDQNLNKKSDNFDNWWNFFDRFMLDHKLVCTNVTCLCSKLTFRGNDNQKIQNTLFAQKIYAMIKRLLLQSSKSINKLKIIENYFLIELQKKPLKTYYQLIKLFASNLNKEQRLEVQILLLQTRDNFKQLFLRQKVQNHDLQVEPLFQFQAKIKTMRQNLNSMAMEYRKFYQIFANNFVQMEKLKKSTKKLSEFKVKFSNEIDYCLENFDKCFELMAFSMIYFRYFDQYANKLQRIQTKAQFLYESFHNPYYASKRTNVDLFDPNYGAIMVDLVFHPGRIMAISKNLCHALGFSHQQISGQKVNKLMPPMFARNHDKFLNNFVNRGSVKMLKYRQKVYYARAVTKFIVPVSVRLKADYSSCRNFCAVTFLRATPTKSEFILMNNYGKIEEMTTGFYKKVLERAIGDDIGKARRLCVTKMILGLNYILKDVVQQDDRVHEGLMLTSDNEEYLMDYYKFPELGKSYKRADNSESNSRSSKSIEHSYSSTDMSKSLDFSDDMQKYNIDLKQSLKDYFKKLQFSKVIGYKIAYKCQDYITNEFKCKILQIMNFREQLTGKQLRNYLSQQILQISEHFGISQTQVQRFKANCNEEVQNTQIESHPIKKAIILQDIENGSIEIRKQVNENKIVQNQRGDSDASSMISVNQESKKKQTMISAFEKGIRINATLQFVLTLLILLMALTLILICAFSIRLKSNYKSLQQDNLIITNFRTNFLLRLAIQQMSQLYQEFDLPIPDFLQHKKAVILGKMKQILIKSTQWISLSKDQYFDEMTLIYADENFELKRSIIGSLNLIYSIFLSTQSQGERIAENYALLGTNFIRLTTNEQTLIRNQSQFYRTQIHIIIGFYGVVLLSLVVLFYCLRTIAVDKENKIIDFLPFLKAHLAKKKVIFYEKFYEFNKDSEDIDLAQVNQIAQNFDVESNTKHLSRVRENIHTQSQQQKRSLLKNANTDERLIKVVKNQKTILDAKLILFIVLVTSLCLFVIFFPEYFFSEAHSKFNAYLQLKNSALQVEIIPSRIVLLYLTNTDRIIQKQNPFVYPSSFTTLAHEKIFPLQKNLASVQMFGTQMEKLITHHFTENICKLITCSQNNAESKILKNQQVYYLNYRYLNAFDYMRKIIGYLPKDQNPRKTIKKWIDENNIVQILKSLEYILDLMKNNQEQVTQLFRQQIQSIGIILLSLSLTLIPILIVIMLYVRRKYIGYVSGRLQCTQNIYKHVGWSMLQENSYAVNYFEDKLRNTKKF